MSVIAIDGPAGAGKTTIARAVAEGLGWDYVDTGAMYRAIALVALEGGADPSDAPTVVAMASDADIVSAGREVFLNGVDVSKRIRESDVTRAVSIVSAHPEIRALLIERQRDAARSRDVVMEGRDIGTVVAPDALVKIFLTASLEERAKRRSQEVGNGLSQQELGEMSRRLAERDEADSSRAASPLQKASDAIEIDTTDKTIDEIRDEIATLVKERLHAS